VITKEKKKQAAKEKRAFDAMGFAWFIDLFPAGQLC